MSDAPGMKNVAIIGFGLLGASFGLALKDVPGIRRLCCTRNPAAREWALAEHAADFASDDPAEIIPRANVTFLSLPLPVIVRYLTDYAHLWRPGSVVTDMGSVKGAILDAAERTVVPRGVVFVGGHPMAGTEYSGHIHAFPTMFRGADVFLCPASNASEADVETIAGPAGYGANAYIETERPIVVVTGPGPNSASRTSLNGLYTSSMRFLKLIFSIVTPDSPE